MKAAVFTFGRMNPPTVGHELVIQKVKEAASQHKADPFIIISKTQDSKKNPLSYADKFKYVKIICKDHGVELLDTLKLHQPCNYLSIMQSLSEKGYDTFYIVVGEDRLSDINGFQKYIGKVTGNLDLTNVKLMKALLSGERDPDSDDVTGISGSKMREYAINKDIVNFKKYLPKSIQSKANEIMKNVRSGLNLHESAANHRFSITVPKLHGKYSKNIILSNLSSAMKTFNCKFHSQKESSNAIYVILDCPNDGVKKNFMKYINNSKKSGIENFYTHMKVSDLNESKQDNKMQDFKTFSEASILGLLGTEDDETTVSTYNKVPVNSDDDGIKLTTYKDEIEVKESIDESDLDKTDDRVNAMYRVAELKDKIEKLPASDTKKKQDLVKEIRSIEKQFKLKPSQFKNHELDSIHESAASIEAKAKGLKYIGFGRYTDSNNNQYVSKNGELVKVVKKSDKPSDDQGSKKSDKPSDDQGSKKSDKPSDDQGSKKSDKPSDDQKKEMSDKIYDMISKNKPVRSSQKLKAGDMFSIAGLDQLRNISRKNGHRISDYKDNFYLSDVLSNKAKTKVEFDGLDMYDVATGKTILPGALSGKHSVAELLNAIKSKNESYDLLSSDMVETFAMLNRKVAKSLSENKESQNKILEILGE